MFETIILAAIASFFLISNNNAWQTFVSYLTSEEQYALSTEHQIFSFEDLDDYFDSNGLPPLCGLYSNPEVTIQDFSLETEYPSYSFYTYATNKTIFVSGGNPVEMQSTDFPPKPINDAKQWLYEGYDYAGCGPLQ